MTGLNDLFCLLILSRVIPAFGGKKKSNMKTEICINCGATEGLHHYKTNQCPYNGMEENRFDKLTGKYYPQKYQDTYFEDSGDHSLQLMAPEMLRILKHLAEKYSHSKSPLSMSDIAEITNVINKAEN